MKAGKLGMLSALLASVCCLGPMILILLGLGSLGLGAVLGRTHWYFLLAAVGILAYAWRGYAKERQRCETAHCEMARGKTTRSVLTIASVFVAIFVGLNLYTYASQRFTSESAPQPASAGAVQIKIPVEGMTCFTCELAVESVLKGLPGVESVDARVVENAAYVNYDSSRVRIDDLIEAINKTGYKATQPSSRGDTE